MSGQVVTVMDSVPREMWANVITFVVPSALRSCREVCTAFRDMAGDAWEAFIATLPIPPIDAGFSACATIEELEGRVTALVKRVPTDRTGDLYIHFAHRPEVLVRVRYIARGEPSLMEDLFGRSPSESCTIVTEVDLERGNDELDGPLPQGAYPGLFHHDRGMFASAYQLVNGLSVTCDNEVNVKQIVTTLGCINTRGVPKEDTCAVQ